MIIEKLKALAKKLGRTPTTPDINQASKRNECPHTSTLSKYFGSINKALVAAGLTPARRGEADRRKVLS